jgi:GDPmannose 4,6-dehydratase
MTSTINKKVALIYGITGMDGSILADKLLEKGYEVHGVIRRSANFNTQKIDHIFDKLRLHYGDLTDPMNVFTIISNVKPDEIYNFAAQSHVKVSAELEHYTLQTNTVGILNILQAVRILKMERTCKIYQASTSEEFGNQTDGHTLLNEDSPKIPVSIYGVSKLAAEHICRIYKEAYGMFVVSSTLFNHEHERRGATFITQKIANYVGKYNSNNDIKPLELGNLNSLRDWSYAEDCVDAIYLMMQQETPDNYVIASGKCYSVRDFAELAFKEIGIEIEWRGNGLDEVGVDKNTNKTLIKINPRFFRDLELHALIGDASKARTKLGWQPNTSIDIIVNKMVQAAIKRKGVYN